MSSFIKDIEDEYPDLFMGVRMGAKKFDPLSSRKKQIIKDWSALPLSDREELVKYMLDYNKASEEEYS